MIKKKLGKSNDVDYVRDSTKNIAVQGKTSECRQPKSDQVKIYFKNK